MERERVIPKSYPTNLIDKNWNERKCYFRKGGTEFLAQVHDLEVRDDDVWVVTLPKSGTTWMQELVWLVMHDFDFEGAKNEHLEVRTPFLEFDFVVYEDLSRAFKPVEDLKSPRQIKAHLPLPLLPAQLWSKKPKTIYVFRNPKDAAISLFYHTRSVGREMDKNIEESMNDYMESGEKLQPIEHAIEFYALRNEPWVLYTSFERMKANLEEVIRQVCEFLGKTINEQQMQQMLHHLSFEQMRDNPKTNHHWEFEQSRRRLNRPYEAHNFVRKGKVGVYKEELSIEMNAKLDKWIKEKLAPHKITLDELLLLN